MHPITIYSYYMHTYSGPAGISGGLFSLDTETTKENKLICFCFFSYPNVVDQILATNFFIDTIFGIKISRRGLQSQFCVQPNNCVEVVLLCVVVGVVITSNYPDNLRE